MRIIVGLFRVWKRSLDSEVRPRIARRFLRLVTPAIIIAQVSVSLADDIGGDKKALALRANVVRISATLQAGSAPQDGFGFVVGRQGDQAVIVTASHVVRDELNPDAVARTPMITFYEDQGSEVIGTLQLGTLAPKSRGDVAVILAPWPDRMAFVSAAQADTVPARGDDVWVIGRGRKWNVPVNPGRISDQDPVDRHLEVEGLSVTGGSSGGPLISKEGIVGMVTKDDPSSFTVLATSIDVIEGLVKNEWKFDWRLTKIKLSPIPTRFNHATGYFVQSGDRWVEYPPYGTGNFTFIPQGVVDGYLYLADPSRVEKGDRNRAFILRIPIQGGMAQWSFPNPFVWKDLYVVSPGS